MEYMVDQLKVCSFSTRDEMGRRAADDVLERIGQLEQEKEVVHVVFAAAPSQNEVLHYLGRKKDWRRVYAYHMDEYIGLAEDHPQNFRHYLNKTIFDKLSFGKIFGIRGEAEDSEAECKRYADLLEGNRPDIVIMGIGENGHIAFNDPPVADFNDPELVKVVELDHKSRRQQVNDGCFPAIDDVPTHAITLTIPALMSASYRYCVVPGVRKAGAVRDTLGGEVGTHCPATVLRTQPGSTLYLDAEAAQK